MHRSSATLLFSFHILILVTAGAPLAFAQGVEDIPDNMPPPEVQQAPAGETATASAPKVDDIERTPRLLTAEETDALPVLGSITSQFEFWLSLLVLLFGLVVALLQFALLRRNQALKSDEVMKTFALTLIVVGTLFAVTAGFGSEQVAPAMGLFGTIAGYLLGKRVGQKQEEGEEEVGA